MFNAVWNALKDGYGLPYMASLLTDLGTLVAHFEADYFKDKDAKNAAIDAICEVLQQHKDA